MQKGRKIWPFTSHKAANLLRHVKQAETTLFSFEELQSFDLPTTRFPFLLQHKGLLIFEIKRPLFWKNGQICPSLDVYSDEDGSRPPGWSDDEEGEAGFSLGPNEMDSQRSFFTGEGDDDDYGRPQSMYEQYERSRRS